MEQPTLTPESRAQREETEFYKDWVTQTLLEGVGDVKDLQRVKDVLNSHANQKLFRDKSIDMELLQQLEAQIDQKIIQEVEETLRDLHQALFVDRLFRVGVGIEGDMVRVEGLAIDGVRVVPIIGGEPYTGPIDEVFIDA